MVLLEAQKRNKINVGMWPYILDFLSALTKEYVLWKAEEWINVF